MNSTRLPASERVVEASVDEEASAKTRVVAVGGQTSEALVEKSVLGDEWVIVVIEAADALTEGELVEGEVQGRKAKSVDVMDPVEATAEDWIVNTAETTVQDGIEPAAVDRVVDAVEESVNRSVQDAVVVAVEVAVVVRVHSKTLVQGRAEESARKCRSGRCKSQFGRASSRVACVAVRCRGSDYLGVLVYTVLDLGRTGSTLRRFIALTVGHSEHGTQHDQL